MNEINLNKYKHILNMKECNDGCHRLNNFIRKNLIKLLVVVILFLSLAIAYRSSDYLKEKIIKYIYTDNISFTKINNMYNKYLGGILPIRKSIDTKEVFNESLNYISESVYYDGVRLTVSDNYLIPSLDDGMVVFVGEKENYGNTVIIENLEGIYTWYGNISNTSLKLYDYIEEGSLIGEVNKYLYLVFSKEDEYLNYEEYIK